MRAIAEIQREIRACSLCFPEGGNRPTAAGSASARVMIIGQAPSRADERTGRMFSGPGGKRLRSWLERADIAESDVYFSALTRCYPGASASGKGDRVPTRQEVRNCRPHLHAELSALQPRLVLLLGGMAVKEFLGPGALTQYVGRLMPADSALPFSQLLHDPKSAVLAPLPHCSGASLWLNKPENAALLDQALRAVADVPR